MSHATPSDTALMRRFLALPADKRTVFQARAREQGIDLAGLPIPARLRESADAPLSYAQQRLWVVEQLSPDTAAYNIPGAVRLTGPLHVPALEQAFAAVIERHEALRTSFHDGPDGARQHVHDDVSFALGFEDWAAGSAPDTSTLDARLQARAREEALLPFALDRAPLLRARLIRLADEDHVLLLTLHHIVADGWSMARLVDECTRCYGAFAQGDDASLPPLPIQYTDYAIWQRAWLDAGEMARQLTYWRAHLGDDHPVLPLPLDRPRPAVPSGRGATHVMQADATLTARLRDLARAQDTTLYTVLLAAYGVWLGRLAGVRDVSVGVPVAGRGRLETEPLIGFFVNTQVMRVPLTPRETFRALVATMKTQAIDAQANADVPFDKLVEALQPARDASVNALFQAKFNHEVLREPSASLTGLRVSPVPVPGQSSHFDLSLDTQERGDTLQLALTYATDLFDGQTIVPLANAFHALLGDLVEAPDARLGEVGLPISAASPAYGADAEWDTADLLDLWASKVAQDGDALAVEGADGAWSRRQLDAHADAIARSLAQAGIGAEDRVALLLPRAAGWVAAMLGVWKLGAAYVPLDPTQPDARVRQLIEASGARALIVAGGPDGPWAAARDSQCEVLKLDALLRAGAGPAVRWPVHPAQAAYVIYTSGSTGLPKGVVVSRGALHNYVQGVTARWHDLPAAAGMAMVSTVAADLGHTTLFGALATGRPLHLMPQDDVLDAGRFAQWMRQRRIGALKIVPGHLKGLLLAAGQDVLPTDWLVIGGEAADAELLALLHQHRPSLRVLNHYGPTETTVGVLTHAHAWARDESVTLPVGQPLPNVTAYVLDADLNPLPPQVPGELYIGGAALARGYLGEPGKTAERFVPDPWRAGARMYRTGDRVRCQADGEIVFLGRADDQVKIRGYRVEPGEVTQAMRTVTGVTDAAAIAERDARGQWQLLGAFIGEATVDAVRDALTSALPSAWVPARFVRLDTLPRTANGKLDRRALMAASDAAAKAASGTQASDEKSMSVLEARIAAVWQGVLKAERVGRDDNFFEIGGDSILALQVIARLKRGDPPLKITLRQLMQHGTVAKLAQALGGDAAPPKADLLVRLNAPMASVPPLFCLHPAVGTVFDYGPLAQALAGQRPVVGIQSRMLVEPAWRDASLDAMAAHYTDLVRATQPAGPYHLMGWSLGGPLALAMAERLQAAGESVAFLGLADPFVPADGPVTASARDWTGDLLDYLVTILPQVDAGKLRAALAPHAGRPLDEGVLASAVDAALDMQSNGGQGGATQGDYASLGRSELAHLFRVTAHLRGRADAHRLAPTDVPVHVWWAGKRADGDRSRLAQALGRAPVHECAIDASHMRLPRTAAWLDDVVQQLAGATAYRMAS